MTNVRSGPSGLFFALPAPVVSVGPDGTVNLADGAGGWRSSLLRELSASFQSNYDNLFFLGGGVVQLNGFDFWAFAGSGPLAAYQVSQVNQANFTLTGASSRWRVLGAEEIDFSGFGGTWEAAAWDNVHFAGTGPGSLWRVDGIGTYEVIRFDGPLIRLNGVSRASVAAGRLLSWDGTQNVYVDPPSSGALVFETFSALSSFDATGLPNGTIAHVNEPASVSASTNTQYVLTHVAPRGLPSNDVINGNLVSGPGDASWVAYPCVRQASLVAGSVTIGGMDLQHGTTSLSKIALKANVANISAGSTPGVLSIGTVDFANNTLEITSSESTDDSVIQVTYYPAISVP